MDKERYCEISEPSIKIKDSFLKALEEYHQEGRNLDQDRNEIENNFSALIQQFKDESLGLNLKPGRVPETTYWIVDEDGYVGRISIRHFLNDHLLQVGGHIGYDVRPSKRGNGYGSIALRKILPKARELGLDKVLLTCDSTNIAAKKIIETNGGLLENEISGEDGKPAKLRYWIKM